MEFILVVFNITTAATLRCNVWGSPLYKAIDDRYQEAYSLLTLRVV